MTSTARLIDPDRPWLRDERDDPRTMNWAATLFNPFGESTKLHFSRAWTLMFMGRVLLYIVPSFVIAILSIAGMKTAAFNKPVDLFLLAVPASLVPFAVFTVLTEFTSFIAHVRRLTEARRPVLLAALVLLPLMLGLAGYLGGAAMGKAQFAAMQQKAAAARAAAENPDSAARPDARPAESRRGGQRGRGGPRGGPPPSEKQIARSAGTGLGLMLWAITSFGVMLWTLLYVARLPNGGQGRKRTGSDLTADEIAAGY